MPQRKQLTWAELRVGLFVLVGLAVLAAGIFYVTGAGILGPKYRIKTLLPEVSGLSKGAAAKLDGVDIGLRRSELLPELHGQGLAALLLGERVRARGAGGDQQRHRAHRHH